MKESSRNDIFQMSKQINSEKDQAQKIVNAYKKVEGYQVIEKKKEKIQEKKNHQPSSTYSNKIKQTLKQLNANKHKEIKVKKNQQIKPTSERPQSRLKIKGCKKIFETEQKIYKRLMNIVMQRVNKTSKENEEKKITSFRRWKLKRIFDCWMQEIILMKIQSQRKKKQENQKLKVLEKQAKQFKNFVLLRKSMKALKEYTKKSIRKRQIQREQLRMKLQKPEKQVTNGGTQNNKVLQKKVRGFLDNLKTDIENKGRLRTIKQKTDQSELRENHNNINFQEEKPETNEQIEQQEIQESERQEVAEEARQEKKGPLSNDELQKRRKQLERKSKNRKIALENLRKDKEKKKKQEQQEKKQIQKQIEQEQKRQKQQQYERYMKAKRQQKEWEQKEKQLNKRASQFNEIRLKNYYGFSQMKKLKQIKKNQCSEMYEALKKVYMKQKLNILCQNLKIIGNEKLSQLYEKMEKRYSRNLLKKSFKGFRRQMEECLQEKEQLHLRHQFHFLKIVFGQWKAIIPKLSVQNYEEERPLILKAQQFRFFNLKEKSFGILKENKDEEQRVKKIDYNKKLIEKGIKNMIEEEENQTINYDQFL